MKTVDTAIVAAIDNMMSSKLLEDSVTSECIHDSTDMISMKSSSSPS